tara:strand:+ start:154 stop:420 length:267 start_codon:yes stop_codon:yes gene_type:complete
MSYIYTKLVNWEEDGVWNNNGKITIHIPFFEEQFNKINYKEVHNLFYYNYDNIEIVEKLHILYIDLNDIVFEEKSWNGFKRANILTTI